MFLLGLRDPGGLTAAIKLYLLWAASFFIAPWIGTIPCIVLVVINIAAMLATSRKLYAIKDSLKFSTDFAKQSAFPKDGSVLRFVIKLQSGMALFLVIGLLVIWIRMSKPLDPAPFIGGFFFYMIGCMFAMNLIFLATKDYWGSHRF
ncbi:hypothetical protein ROA7450_01633 [Roseovarius albus]|uniref:Uncharacterized protein n=1 Tax=Roseovarius albus TaxID=1247867 RepID=A0A1X6YY89_9RHOB|nr:hypothetical protein [Roseovarius albus]SLN35263.1 hypothetical protein ROA7450_01633 [Roseovarius albus]